MSSSKIGKIGRATTLSATYNAQDAQAMLSDLNPHEFQVYATERLLSVTERCLDAQ